VRSVDNMAVLLEPAILRYGYFWVQA